MVPNSRIANINLRHFYVNVLFFDTVHLLAHSFVVCVIFCVLYGQWGYSVIGAEFIVYLNYVHTLLGLLVIVLSVSYSVNNVCSDTVALY